MNEISRKRATNEALGTAPSRQALFTALEALIRKGHRYADITVKALVGEAKCSRANFYLHFSDKQSLMLAFTEDYLTDIGERLGLDRHMLDADSKDTIRKGLFALNQNFRDNLEIFRLLQEACEIDPAINAMRTQVFSADPQNTIDPFEREVRLCLTWMIERCTYQSITPDTPLDVREDPAIQAMIEAATAIIWATREANLSG